MTCESHELATIYSKRFEGAEAYRNQVWRVLIADFFAQWISKDATVLDLGCGYGEFINNVPAAKKFGMDLNPDTARRLNSGIQFIQQDCSATWPLPDNTLDVVFTSNFFEHLPDKRTLSSTLTQTLRCLKPGGRLIAMGPNIKYLPGAYWDFWDHYLPLTEASLDESLRVHGFEIVRNIARFLPYTMAHGPRYPIFFLKAYLKIPLAWRIFGKQFVLVARKPSK